ncbi:hypothetical protein [Streptomyces tanashiensis]|uniref:Uncharacterized protein n=1 Tax=Streptomyces tanashiensis TaxID=67367 RepID=A0ABY6QRG4_9ACTN|nr:hypothetical protein [Streptomyces tanashiensis]UZX20385.1 hypothetical protein LDH80_06530 [Streptomyces tanashiensis]
MVHFPAQQEQLVAVPPTFVGVCADDVDGLSVTAVGKGVRETGEQLVVALDGCRVGHGLEGQIGEFGGGQGSVEGGGVSDEGSEDRFFVNLLRRRTVGRRSASGDTSGTHADRLLT